MQIISRLLISSNNDDDHYEVLGRRQTKIIITMIISEIMFSFQ